MLSKYVLIIGWECLVLYVQQGKYGRTIVKIPAVLGKEITSFLLKVMSLYKQKTF